MQVSCPGWTGVAGTENRPSPAGGVSHPGNISPDHYQLASNVVIHVSRCMPSDAMSVISHLIKSLVSKSLSLGLDAGLDEAGKMENQCPVRVQPSPCGLLK